MTRAKASYNILQDAADHWPEDEAYSLFDFRYLGVSEPNETQIKKDILHLETIFMAEQDGPELVARFHCELNKLKGVTA